MLPARKKSGPAENNLSERVVVVENMPQDACYDIAYKNILNSTPEQCISVIDGMTILKQCRGYLMKHSLIATIGFISLGFAAVFSVHADDSQTKQRLARMPDTPVEQLQQLAVDSDWRVRREVATNRRAPTDLLYQLAG
ncbi:MAG: hypothetical protein R3354_01260, partial [Thiohalomonadales bacterium]|nr:hypothetical protein [Thiohalomonadales bacterium]